MLLGYELWIKSPTAHEPKTEFPIKIRDKKPGRYETKTEFPIKIIYKKPDRTRTQN